MGLDTKFRNVLLLGLSFMLVFTAFQTMGNIEQTVINSIQIDDPSFKGDGYTSLAIIYAVFAICNWFAPSFVAGTGPRCAIFCGAITYAFFIATFLFPRTWLLYLASAIIGVGAAVIWTGQGNYLTLNSNKDTMSRNSGIFWALLQCSMFFGNLFVYIQFEGSSIDADTRKVVFCGLLAVALLGIVCIFLLRPAAQREDVELNEASSPLSAFKAACNLFTTRDMILLSFTFLYTGLELSFYSSVYSSSIGFTVQMGENVKKLVGLSGIFIGVGEVSGGALFGILGSKTTRRGRDPIVIAGYLIHLAAFFLIFLNIPNDAPLGQNTNEVGFISPSPVIAMFCSFMLGFADSCYNTQIFSILGVAFADSSAEAFALFKFTQSVGAAAAFFYSSHVGLYVQIAILVITGTIGTISFVRVEVLSRRKLRNTVAD